MFDSILSETPWPWLGVPLIILVAALGVSIIWMTTRWAISAMAEAAGNALRKIDTVVAPARAAIPPFVTEGIASLRYNPEAVWVRFARRFQGETARASAEASLEEMTVRLREAGIRPLDISPARFHASDEGIEATLSVVLTDSATGSMVSEVALAMGFRENRAQQREGVRIDQFQEMMGRLAIETAIVNMKVLKEEMEIPGVFALVSADLATVVPGGVDVDTVMRARMTWRIEDED